MVSNYEQITEENLKRYGTDIDRYGPVFLTSLYSERTHFIYGLLQNAEDAGATKITFKLFNDRLEFYHNGRLFTESDVRGICGLVESTKKEDLTKIGKFGIGFKSVYAYTDSPEIHSGDEHFCIEHYVKPRAVTLKNTLGEINTLFIIKFNRQDIFKVDACCEIGSHLRQLNSRNLLFLRHIEEINWHLENGQEGTYRRKILQNGADYRQATITVNTSFGKSQEDWLVFEQQVPSQPTLKVEVAFRLQKDKKTNKDQIIPIEGSHLVVFFPTEKETHLNFLVQGPYRTTPDRAKIPPKDTFNRELIESTAELVANVLPKLKDIGLLTVGCLQLLPIRASEFSEDAMFYSVFDKVRETLKEKALLPTAEGHYVSATQAKLARSAALRKLLSDAQLQQIYGGNYTWLSDEISENTTPELHRYLRDVLKVEEIDPEKFALKFHKAFIESQSDKWVAEFYAFLKNQEALWKVENFRKNPPLLNKPFIRLQNSKHVIPFDNNNIPNAYLPTDVTTSSPLVKREILENPEAKTFLERLGLPKPSIYVEVRDRIIPKYHSTKLFLIDSKENERDIQAILHALHSSTSTERKQLLEKLQKTPFLRAVNAKTNRQEYQPPEKIYFRSQNLEVYFEGNEAVWFLDNIAIDQGLLLELGVSKTVRLYYTHPNTENYVIISEARGNHKRGIKGFDSNFYIDGLAYALENPKYDKSVYIWNYLLLPNRQQLRGQIESSSYKNYHNAERETTFSKAGHIAYYKDWLPNLIGNYCQPATLSLDDLPEDFIRDKYDEALAIFLGVKPRAALVEEAKRVGIEPELLDHLRKNPRVQKLLIEKLIKGASSEGTGKSATSQNTTFDHKNSPEPDLPRIDYITAIKEAFSQTGITELTDTVPPSPATNPEARLQKIQENICKDKGKEPLPSERFKKIETTKWEGKNTLEVRSFLKETYGGKCQVCEQTFPKRNGDPYFEGVYLVSYTKARWIDQRGNVLCLCANCCAKFKHGSVESADILEQIQSLQFKKGKLHIKLCGQETYIRFHDKHIIELQALLNTALASKS